MISASNSDQRWAASSNLCEEIFSSATEYTEELAHNIDVILQHQDVRQRHHPDEQNRKEEGYGEDPSDDFDEEQYNIKSFCLDYLQYVTSDQWSRCLDILYIMYYKSDSSESKKVNF